MREEYAVTDENQNILFQSEGFDASKASRSVTLSGGRLLLICGDPEADDLRRRLAEANASNQAKETFLSNMSHDIRTPMNAIVGMTALAKKHIDEKTRVADALNKIETASGHLLSLINDVLDMSRINSGRMQIQSDLFMLGDLVHDTMTIIRPQIEEKGHAWHLSLQDIEEESLYGDALRLRQIYVNILNNAVKYTPPGGRIDIAFSETVREDVCHLVFSCRDNGIGMSEEFLRRIFEPFERVQNYTISKIEGTGLGMSIVKKLVESMEGTIDVESREGEGTFITISVPLAYEKTKISTAALDGKRLLVLEKDEQRAALYGRYLDEAGIRSTVVPSPGDILSALTDAQFGDDPYDAVVFGTIPESERILETASYLQKSNPELTMVLVSDQNWDEIEYRANRAGIHDFIPVPFFRTSLINGLNKALQQGASGVTQTGCPDLSGKRILLVEDNMINREIAKEILSATNAVIDTAEDGQIAVDMYENAPDHYYQLILMDIQMPVKDGYEAAREIRGSAKPDAGEVCIFAMTANTFAEDIAKAREAGMDGHIAKPIDFNVLMQTLQRLRS